MLEEHSNDVMEKNSQNPVEKFLLEPSLTPARKKQPYPFTPNVKKFGLAKMLIKEVLSYNIKLLVKKEYRTALLSRPCIYGVFGGPFGGFLPRKELCTGCFRCVQEFPSFCTVERNMAFTSSSDSYWAGEDPERLSTSPVATVTYEAETGKIPIKGMGYKGSFSGPGWDNMWTDMSEIVRPTRDGVHGREYISTLVDLGRKPAFLEFKDGKVLNPSKTIPIPLPIIFDALPPNLNMRSVQESIRKTSMKIGTMFIERVPTPSKGATTANPFMIPLVKYEEYQINESPDLEETKVVELVYHPSWDYDELKTSFPHLPVIVRIPFEQGVDFIARAINLTQLGIDAFHFHANYHGNEFGASHPQFVKELLLKVHRRLVEEGLRDEITIIASGGIILAEHVSKAIICGADLVAIDTAILMALQCQFKGDCLSAETGHVQKETFSVEWGVQRLINLMVSWHDQLIEILSAMGMRDVRRLRGDVGRAMFNENLEKEAFGDIPHI